MHRRQLRKVVAALAGGVLVLSACGGSDAASVAEPQEQLPAVADDIELRATSDLSTNQLPNVVVDNLNDDNKVNLRNYAPSDRPILLWMWAPH